MSRYCEPTGQSLTVESSKIETSKTKMGNHPCYKVFTEINFHNSRLGVLGDEAIRVLEDMKSEGMSSEVLEPLFAVAKKAAGLEDCKTSVETKVKNSKRCKWWNRGFCREREKCSFLHQKEHLSGLYH